MGVTLFFAPLLLPLPLDAAAAAAAMIIFTATLRWRYAALCRCYDATLYAAADAALFFAMITPPPRYVTLFRYVLPRASAPFC